MHAVVSFVQLRHEFNDCANCVMQLGFPLASFSCFLDASDSFFSKLQVNPPIKALFKALREK